MSLKNAILGLLNIRPMSGYSIKKNFDGPISGFWSASYGGLYPALNRLENKGLITGEVDEEDSRNKKIYSITDQGKKELNNWFFEETNETKCKDEYMLKIFLSKDLENKDREMLIKEYIFKKEKLLKQLKRIDNGKTDKVTHQGIDIILDYSIETLEYEIKTLKNILEKQ